MIVMVFQEILHTLPAGEDAKRPLPRILVIDGEPAILFAYQKLIKSEGFTVDACEKIEDALGLISSHNYFAVITDIRFAESEYTDGIRLLHAVRTQQSDAKIIIVTGYGNDGIEHALKELDFSHYFEKPVKPSLIMALLKAAHTVIEEQLDDFECGYFLPEVSEAELL